ncbi:gamma-glutamylcyclotransferase 2-3 isoform X2 [Capsicum annuum]|uniref:gamma-glutamylcyclotransferase 2-3 isoform X2 n=1 Tax=Capsicum annuum TaxID=4072 RepID=UPI001FB0724D|nr:gamma-glutamylcyclotransferase 2-3 isoform X2 [Capsicum annuum]
MVMWVFGYGSLIWKPGFNYDDHLVGFIKGYRRVFYQVLITEERQNSQWGMAYKITKKEDQEVALTYLEVREKQYDKKAYVDLFTEPATSAPAVSGVLVYIGSPDKKVNENYLGPASVEEIASQIARAEGPSGPNKDYLFQLEKALDFLGCEDKHVSDIAKEVRRILSEEEVTIS